MSDIFFNPIWDIRMTDTSLRDGSHHKRHQFTKDEVGAIVAALDTAGVPVIEVTHGDGLGGSSFNYGFSKTPEQELIKLAAETAKESKIAFLMLPGVGTKEDIKEAQNNGGSICRIATHCTEADVSIQHFGLARELGLETVGFLMMSHTIPPEKLAAQARIMADAGCQCVYVVDSAGALVLEGVADRVAALVAELGDDAQVGFHGHENLGLGVANSVEAVRAGAKQIDGSCRRFGAGAGNAPVEALIGVFDKIGVKTGIDFFDIADAAEEVVAPAMPAECLLDRNALIMGYSGVYSSFLKHAIRQSERYGVPAHQLLHRAGQRKLIGGQEDQLIDIALEIKREQEAAPAKPEHRLLRFARAEQRGARSLGRYGRGIERYRLIPSATWRMTLRLTEDQTARLREAAAREGLSMQARRRQGGGGIRRSPRGSVVRLCWPRSLMRMPGYSSDWLTHDHRVPGAGRICWWPPAPTSGTRPEVRDYGLLESALARPKASVFGEDAYQTIHEKAAALLDSLVNESRAHRRQQAARLGRHATVLRLQRLRHLGV